MAINKIRSVRRKENRGPFKVSRRTPTGGWRFGYDELIKRVAAPVALAFT